MINADPRTRDSIWMAVTEALSSLADPRVLDAVNPPPGEEFDPADFLQHNGTLYLLATGAGAGASWALVAAFIEDLAETPVTSPQHHPAHDSTRHCSWPSTRSATSHPSPRYPR